MKKHWQILALLLLSSIVQAQYYFHKQWDKRYGGLHYESLWGIVNTKDAGFFLLGYSHSGIGGDKTQDSWGNNDMWLVKIDSLGIIEWDKRFGGIGHDVCVSVLETTDGGYIVGGYFYFGSGGDHTQSAWGGGDYWIVKITATGVKQWDKRFGGYLNDEMFTLLKTSDNGFLLGGLSNSGIGGDKTQENWDMSHSSDDYWIIKVDSAGNKEWDRRYGGSDEDILASILQTPDGGYLLGGTSSSDSSGDKTQTNWGAWDYWVIKVDSVGNKEWDRRYGGIGGDVLTSMVKSIYGGYLLAGFSTSDSSGEKTQNRFGPSEDYWILKIDTAGNKEWDKSYGGNQEDILSSVVYTTDGGFLLSGRSQSQASGNKSENNLAPFQTWVVKTDALGNKQWDKTIFLNTSCNNGFAVQTNDGCFIAGNDNASSIGGYKSQPSWDGTNDYWILKFCMEEWNSISPLAPEEVGIQMQVYPNPFTDDLSIAFKAPFGGLGAEAAFTITDVTGKVIYHKQETNLAPGYTKVLDLRWLASGVYFVTIEREGECITKRVIKE